MIGSKPEKNAEENEEITQLQLENRELDKRLTKIEGCYECPNMKVIYTKDEMYCPACKSTFVHKMKGGKKQYGK